MAMKVLPGPELAAGDDDVAAEEAGELPSVRTCLPMTTYDAR
jgi:hypothetical protein